MFRRPLLLFGALVAVLVAAACSNSTVPVPQPAPTTPAPAHHGSIAAAPAIPEQLGTLSGVATTFKSPDFAPLPGAKARFGQLGKAVYQIEIPDKWNGDLVMYAHGFAGFGTQLSVQPPPDALRQLFISEGFAWAASSFSENGYTPGLGADDTLALKEYFAQTVGKPAHTYIVGESMGGNVVTLSLEHFPLEYNGALSLCGAVAGEEEIDYLMSWLAVAEFTSGVPLPIGQGVNAMTTAVLQQMAPQLGTADNLTLKGQQFADVIQNLTGGPRPFFSQGFRDQYLLNFSLALLDPNRTSIAGRAATNVGVTYHIDPGLGLTDAALNAGIQRFVADPTARNAALHPDAVPTTGNISVPLLTLHGTGDLFVPISEELSYYEKVQAAGKSDLLVQRIIRSAGHCNFSDQEITSAFNDLVSWVRDGKKPAGDNMTAPLTNAGLQFTNPLRPGDPGTK